MYIHVLQRISKTSHFTASTTEIPVEYNPYHPWDWYIYLHEWLGFCGFHVGNYIDQQTSARLQSQSSEVAKSKVPLSRENRPVSREVVNDTW